ncbi:DUF2897 family protein [Pseudoalteromonas sp.]|jgi:hypothetical protein|uniref:DUF2897 family protein n=1 Tax=Pseudoalteromonas sp. TaxID=53249 RepID=UPI00356ACEDB
MQTWHMVLIVVIVFAIIIGNLALIKHSANMPFKKTTRKDSNVIADSKKPTDTKKP